MLRLGNQWIESKQTMRFLSVIIDNKLNWKAQCAAALANGQDWFFKISRVTKTTKGIHTKQIRQL